MQDGGGRHRRAAVALHVRKWQGTAGQWREEWHSGRQRQQEGKNAVQWTQEWACGSTGSSGSSGGSRGASGSEGSQRCCISYANQELPLTCVQWQNTSRPLACWPSAHCTAMSI